MSGTSNKYGSHAFLLYSQNCEPLAQQQVFVNYSYPSFKVASKIYNDAIAIILLCVASIGLSSCSSTKTIGLTCQERQIEIYVDDEYLGRDLVYYTVPKGREYIEVSCRERGMEVYHRRINVKDRKGTLIELQIPKNYKYSSKPF